MAKKFQRIGFDGRSLYEMIDLMSGIKHFYYFGYVNGVFEQHAHANLWVEKKPQIKETVVAALQRHFEGQQNEYNELVLNNQARIAVFESHYNNNAYQLVVKRGRGSWGKEDFDALRQIDILIDSLHLPLLPKPKTMYDAFFQDRVVEDVQE